MCVRVGGGGGGAAGRGWCCKMDLIVLVIRLLFINEAFLSWCTLLKVVLPTLKNLSNAPYWKVDFPSLKRSCLAENGWERMKLNLFRGLIRHHQWIPLVSSLRNSMLERKMNKRKGLKFNVWHPQLTVGVSALSAIRWWTYTHGVECRVSPEILFASVWYFSSVRSTLFIMVKWRGN